MSEIKNAVCKFCGQIFCDVVLPDDVTESELLEEGTKRCRCGHAMAYQTKKRQARKAKLELSTITEEKPEQNIRAVDYSIVLLLENGIDSIAEDKICQIKVTLCSGGTIDIKSTSSGKMTVARAISIKQKREVE